MKLYLVQHADAKSKDVDEARPLSEKGRQDAEAMASFLGGAGVRVDEIVHSGKLRAEQTAVTLAQHVFDGRTPSVLGGIGPNDSVNFLCNTIMAAGGDLMVVGHMPFLSRIAAKCLSGSEDSALVGFDPGSVLCLNRLAEGDCAHHWALDWFVKPSLLPGQ